MKMGTSWDRKKLKMAAMVLVIVITAFFLGRLIADSRREIVVIYHQADLTMIALAMLPLLASYWINSLVWKVSLEEFGTRVPAGHAFIIVNYSQISKYIPGRIWVALGLMKLAWDRGVAPEKSLGAMALANIYVVASGCIITLISVFTSNSDIALNPLWLILLVAACLPAMHPKTLHLAVETWQNLTGRNVGELKASYKKIVLAMSIGAIYWIAVSISFWILALSLYPAYDGGPFVLTGAIIVSWLLGFMAFFMPGGLGVREASMAYILAPAWGNAFAVTMAIASRALFVVGDLCALMIAVIISRVIATRKIEESVTGSSQAQ